METPSNVLIIFIVLTVLLFTALGIALVVLMDHKARIPGGFTSNPFSIIGIHREHPVIAFLTTTILFAVIASLLFEISVTLMERMGFFQRQEVSGLLLQLREERYTERMRHFHNEPTQNMVDLGRKQACYYCHGDYPHSKKPMVRSLLNMHTQFVGCMTCHVDSTKLPEESYRFDWLNYSGIEVSGAPYGTAIDEQNGFLITTDDYYSKIVVYAKREGEERLLELTEDQDEVRDFVSLAARGRLTEQDREALKRRFHGLVNDSGRKCSNCHALEDESYLPFRQLGFSEQRVLDLTNLNIIGVVEKYHDFYLPNLMKNESHSREMLLQESANTPDAVSTQPARPGKAKGK